MLTLAITARAKTNFFIFFVILNNKTINIRLLKSAAKLVQFFHVQIFFCIFLNPIFDDEMKNQKKSDIIL
jgi:hypothetical protein